MTLHPRIRDAAKGKLPEWARAGSARREHMERVAELMGSWAESSGAPEEEAARWRASAYLHDALREADPDALWAEVPPPLRDLPGAVLHGPAVAERLRAEGVQDEPFLTALAYHSLGHPDLDRLGRALYVADFLEPGRRFLKDWRAELRARMPSDLQAVLREVLTARLRHLVDRGVPLRTSTVGFWNVVVGPGAASSGKVAAVSPAGGPPEREPASRSEGPPEREGAGG